MTPSRMATHPIFSTAPHAPEGLHIPRRGPTLITQARVHMALQRGLLGLAGHSPPAPGPPVPSALCWAVLPRSPALTGDTQLGWTTSQGRAASGAGCAPTKPSLVETALTDILFAPPPEAWVLEAKLLEAPGWLSTATSSREPVRVAP